MSASGPSMHDPVSEHVVDVEVLRDDSVHPEVVELRRGGRIRWTNNTARPCVVTFGSPSPFEGNRWLFEIPAGKSELSERISQSATSASLEYSVKFQQSSHASRGGTTRGSGYESLRSPVLNPTIVIKT